MTAYIDWFNFVSEGLGSRVGICPVRLLNGLILISFAFVPIVSFYFLITYGVCKKRKYCNRMSEKKEFSPFDECSCFVCFRRQNKQTKISVCLSVWLYERGCTWLYVWLYVRGLFMWTQ